MKKGLFKKFSYDISKVVGVDPKDPENAYILENGKLTYHKKSLKGSYLLTTYLEPKDVIPYSFEVEKKLLGKIDIDSYIETKAYEEAGLDETQEYIFNYKILENFIDDKKVLAEILIVPKENVIEQKYKAIKDKTNYIDSIVYPGYVFEVLYKENYINMGNDLFVYFTKTAVFLSVYSEGKFLQSLAFSDHSLDSIYNQIIDNLNIKDFDYNLFLEVLHKKGLNETKYTEKDMAIFNVLSEIFSNAFLYISNQIYGINRKFSIESIDRVFVTTEKGTILGISEFSNLYLGLETRDLKFDIRFNDDDIEIDQLLFLSMLYSQMLYKVNNQRDNFTLYYRPHSFFYRSGGHFITATIASFVISAAPLLFNMGYTQIVKMENEDLQATLNQKKTKQAKLSNANKQFKNELAEVNKQIDAVNKEIENNYRLIENIYNAKNNYLQKSDFLLKLTRLLNKNKVFLESVEVLEGYMDFNLIAKKEQFIVDFTNDLYTQQHVILTTEGFIEEEGLYKSTIKVKNEK